MRDDVLAKIVEGSVIILIIGLIILSFVMPFLMTTEKRGTKIEVIAQKPVQYVNKILLDQTRSEREIATSIDVETIIALPAVSDSGQVEPEVALIPTSIFTPTVVSVEQVPKVITKTNEFETSITLESNPDSFYQVGEESEGPSTVFLDQHQAGLSSEPPPRPPLPNGSVRMEVSCQEYIAFVEGPAEFVLNSLQTRNGSKNGWNEHLSDSIIKEASSDETITVKIGLSLDEDEAQVKAQGTIDGEPFSQKFKVSCGRRVPPFQLAVGLPPNLTGILVEQADSDRAEEIYRKQGELAGRTGWVGEACPANNSRYSPDPKTTGPIELHVTGKTEKAIPGRGDAFQITAIYQRPFGGSLEALAGYDRRDGAALGGDLFSIYFPEGPSHKLVPDYSAHWALIMGPGGERGGVNLRKDFTTDMANPIYVAEMNHAAEVLNRWRMFIGLDHTKKPESCILAEKSWDGWLIDASVTRNGLMGPYNPIITVERVIFPGLTCTWWGCYYDGWEFTWPAGLDHAAFSDGQGNLLISEEDRQAIVDAISWPKLDGEKLIYDPEKIHNFFIVFSRVLYQNGLDMYVTRVPEEFQSQVGFSGSGVDFVYLAYLESEANRLGGFAGKARAGLEEGWNRKHPDQSNRPDLVRAAEEAEAMADEARELFEKEKKRILGE